MITKCAVQLVILMSIIFFIAIGITAMLKLLEFIVAEKEEEGRNEDGEE